MTKGEKLDAALNRLVNRPTCHCGKTAVLQVPSKPELFTPFYRCGERDNVSAHAIHAICQLICVSETITFGLQSYFQRGFPACDFEEYNYGPKSHWPYEWDVKQFASGNMPWPCLKLPDKKCQCGIKAREGVVPSELGYGHYCGNAYGGPNEFFVSPLNCLS
jgi:hypothetical protein